MMPYLTAIDTTTNYDSDSSLSMNKEIVAAIMWLFKSAYWNCDGWMHIVKLECCCGYLARRHQNGLIMYMDKGWAILVLSKGMLQPWMLSNTRMKAHSDYFSLLFLDLQALNNEPVRP